MTDHLRPIVIEDFAGVTYATQPGPAPQTQWIELDALRIDDRYQRPIGQRGKMQIRRIAERFRWSRFAPVIVAPIEGGLYAVIDGQHRCHAARLRSIKSVPCMVSMVDEVEQAEAFAEINTRQLAVTPAVLHKSRVASRDPKALALEQVLEAAGARVVTPRHQKELKRGDTFAVAILYKLQDLYGDEILQRALEAVVQVGEGNVGLLRAPVLQAYCATFEAAPPPERPSRSARCARQLRPGGGLRYDGRRDRPQGRTALAAAGDGHRAASAAHAQGGGMSALPVNLPPSLALVPNIPHERQTLRQLHLERAWWQRRVDTSGGWGAALAAAMYFRDACDRWIARREAEERAR